LFLAERGQGWQGSETQAYWLVGRVLLTPPAETAASQKWKIIYLHVLKVENLHAPNHFFKQITGLSAGISWLAVDNGAFG
jgi:hypothetical protein